MGSCRAGMLELNGDAAKIQAEYPQGNNLFVHREQCRAGGSRAALGSGSSRSDIPAGMERDGAKRTGLSLPPARPLRSSVMAL